MVALLDGIPRHEPSGGQPDRNVVLEAMRGKTWTQLAPDLQPLAIHCFGSALANVHSLPTDFGRRLRSSATAWNGCSTARPWSRRPGRTSPRPPVASHDELARGPPSRETIVCLHGDVHANNVLFDGDQVHLIDFDQGGSGVASADLGSMLASLMAARPSINAPTPLPKGSALRFSPATARCVRSRPRPNCAGTSLLHSSPSAPPRSEQGATTPALAVLPELLSMAESRVVGEVATRCVSAQTLLFYCQHALGLGHLVRSLRWLRRSPSSSTSFCSTVAGSRGGTQVPEGVRVVNLPPLGHDSNFELVSHDPQWSVESAMRERPRIILDQLPSRNPKWC